MQPKCKKCLAAAEQPKLPSEGPPQFGSNVLHAVWAISFRSRPPAIRFKVTFFICPECVCVCEGANMQYPVAAAPPANRGKCQCLSFLRLLILN